MLNSPEEEVLAKACEAIHRYAEKGDDNKGTLVGLGAVEPLSKLISHQDRLVRRNAVMALGAMASHNEVKRCVKKLDVIPSVIGRLAPEEDVVTHEYATLFLAYLSIEYTSKVQIFDHDGLDPLIQLLSSPDPDVKKNSVECIYNLVQDFPSRAAVRELKGVPPLLELLQSEFPLIQQIALKTLAMVTNDADSRVALRENQGLDRLLEFLGTKEFTDLHVEALRVISNCLEDDEAVQFLQETGGLDRLLLFTANPSLPEAQMNAARAISRAAAKSSETRKILHEHDVEKVLISLLAVEHDGVRGAACHAIAVMCDNLANKDAFRNHEGVRPVVQLLSSDNAEVKEAAALALSSLTNSNQLNAYAVFEAEGAEALVQQLAETREGAVAFSAAVLTNMAAQEMLRSSILSHGAVQSLTQPLLSSSSLVLSKATLALAALCCDSEGRTEIRNSGGLVPLVKLLNSHHTEVRRNACWAALVCAGDEPTAIEMCKLGALEILQDINSSSNLRNKFSEAALHKLLDSNLSVKYSLTGYLSPSNITTDGFYDPGQTKTGHRVPALEHLSKQDVHQHRAVILVNGKPHEQETPEPAHVDEKQQDSPGAARSSSVLSKSSTKDKTPSKGKSKGRKEDEKLKDEEETKHQQETAPENMLWVPPHDSAFQTLVIEASNLVQPLHEPREQAIALAKLVSDAMGGSVERERLHEFIWELHLSELKFELKSNVIPIGKIQKGIYYHRALLFKVLADRVGLSCSLVRGEYNRAWNQVLLVDRPPGTAGRHLQPETYIVDLMHRPGHLMKDNSPEAIQYQLI
ncbi:armadillo repeat-containing protein 3 isoform X2 [Amia ocellicauda]